MYPKLKPTYETTCFKTLAIIINSTEKSNPIIKWNTLWKEG